jgi:hypothetical protein
MRLALPVSMVLMFAGFTWSQAITDAAGVIAGGSVGGVAGKKVGQGVTSVFQKVGGVTAKAANTEKSGGVEKPKERAGAVLQTSPGGVVRDHSLVPPPPPKKKVVATVPEPPAASVPVALTALRPIPVLPPPPQATAEELKTLPNGTSRAEVLKFGAPASRITMIDDGHLVEIYRYQARDTTFGVVRLSDGSVSSVQVR